MDDDRQDQLNAWASISCKILFLSNEVGHHLEDIEYELENELEDSYRIARFQNTCSGLIVQLNCLVSAVQIQQEKTIKWLFEKEGFCD